jgi:signal transduction histidine kinase/AraC-like DNA-binding protein/ABC-type sugar transport system substrate-binding protein
MFNDLIQTNLRSRPRIGTLIYPNDPYWIQTLESILHANRSLGDDLVVLQPAATLDAIYAIPPQELIDKVLAQDLDAVICALASDEIVFGLTQRNIPMIYLTESDLRYPYFTTVGSLYEGGKLAGEYIGQRLSEGGHAVCITAGLEEVPVRGEMRQKGFLDGLAAHPQVSVGEIPAYWTYKQSYSVLLDALVRYPRHIDAIFGVSDSVILAALEAGREMGVLHDSTILVGLNGDPAALIAVSEGRLSATVDIAAETLGVNALHLAHRAAQGQSLPATIPVKFQLITRGNVDTIALRKLSAIAHIPDQMVGYNRNLEQSRMSQLEISMQIAQQIDSLQELEQLVQLIHEMVNRHYGYEWVRILRWSDRDNALVLYGGVLSPAAALVSLEHDDLLQAAFSTGTDIQISDTRRSTRWHPGKEWDSVRSRVLLPIHLGGEVMGVLDLQSATPVRQPSMEIVGLKLLANQLGIVMQNFDLYQVALQARETAEKANELKNRLIANVGHEMRTPLNSILGFSQSIQKQIQTRTEVSPEDLLQDVKRIYQSGEHLMYMINDLLDLSRAEIGALSLYFEQLQPAPFLREVFNSFAEAETPFPKVHWVLDMPARLPVIRADTVRLRQILVNLLANATKFTHSGSITLGAAVEPPFLHLWVRDTGPGVSLEFQEKIFEPFSTAVRKRRPEGMGLGLSITRHLVALHNGMITLESQPGQGSVFHIYLPLPGMAQIPATQVRREGQNLLLVISRQPSVPEEILQICRRESLEPVLVASHDDLSRAFSLGVPVCLAWDLVNASASEWIFIHQLSAHQACSALPVLLYGQSPNENGEASGLTNVIFKPCPDNTLLAWIDQSELSAPDPLPVLVVDDDPQARDLYLRLLKTSHPGCRVIQAENGRQALDILKDTVPSLILLDLMMPDVDGFGVLQAVRADPRTARVPVTIISGKLLTFEDVQRLNHLRTSLLPKGILAESETVEFLKQVESGKPALPQPTSLLVKQVVAFIQQNYTQPLSRKQIADAVGVSENYLSQIFRQELSISPLDYLTRLRIQQAKELLAHSHKSVTQVAVQVGFNDSAYFSRVFHKLTGCSPLEFRQSSQI